jgi:hypothetical protein
MATNGTGEITEPKKTCFLVCPIGGDASPQRKHSDQALRHIIAPVLKDAGFDDAYRADKISEGGSITRQIINHIREDDLVIADLTGHNPNVFYELAIRHCTGKPFVQMIRKGESIPFDLGPMRTIFFDLTDPDDVVATRAELARQVASAMAAGAQVDTPIGQAMDFEKLRSGTETDQLLVKVIERLDAIDNRGSAQQPKALRMMTEGERIVQTALGGWQYENKTPGSFSEGGVQQLTGMVESLLRSGGAVNAVGLGDVIERMSGGMPPTVDDLRAIAMSSRREKGVSLG